MDNVSTGDDGANILTTKNTLQSDAVYLTFVRHLNGYEDAYPPYAYLFVVREKNWRYTVIGEEINVAQKKIVGGKLTLTFNTKQWVRMSIYRVM